MIYVYKVSKNGLELVFSDFTDWDELVKIGDKWIYTNNFGPSRSFKFTLGYYLYEDGEFKYIDRLANGEPIADENGELPENFKKIVFENNDNDGGPEILELSTETEFNIISCKIDDKGYKIVSIRIIKGGYADDEGFETKTTIPEGTILDNMRISFMW